MEDKRCVCTAEGMRRVYEKAGREILLCDSCGIFSVRPLPDIETQKRFYNQNFKEGIYTNRLKKDAADLRERTFNLWFDIIENFISSGGKILDVGCADGVAMKVAEERGFSVYGNDLSEVASAAARERWDGRVFSGLTINDLNVQRGFFDCITMFDFIEHTINPYDYIVRAKELLRSHGMLVIATHDARSWTKNILGQRWSYLNPDEHLHYFSEKPLRLLLQKAGYIVLSIFSVPKIINLEFLYQEFRNSDRFFYIFFKMLKNFLPRRLWRHPLKVFLGELLALARKES